MKVQFTFVGMADRPNDIVVDLDAVPREGEVVGVPGVSQADTYVRTVVWYPLGEDPDETDDPDLTPFVYVVLGRRRVTRES